MTIKNEMTRKALELASGSIVPCTKLSLDNIIFPKWSDTGLWGQILAMRVKTKEQPDGYDYPEAIWQIVVRILDGKVYMTGGRPDAYAWRQEKVQDYLNNPSKIRYVGVNSGSAIVNLAAMLNKISDDSEKLALADFFSAINRDLILVTSAEESRRCFEVTQELYDAGLTQIVDSWVEPDKEGQYKVTELQVGDFVIVENPEKIYCIRREEFMTTHKLA